MSNIQAVIFEKKYYTLKEAVDKLKNMGLHLLKGKQWHETTKFWRARLKPPESFKRFITKKFLINM